MSKPKKPNPVPRANGTVERIKEPQNGQTLVATSFQGPLPPPALLEDYDAIVPGLAAQIVEWTTSQTAHRQQIESRTVAIDEKLSTAYVIETLLGQLFAFLITLSVLAGTVYLAMHDHSGAAATLGALGFGGIITAFIVGRRTRSAEDPSEKKSK